MSTFFWLLGWVFDWRTLAIAAVIGVIVAYRILGRTAATALAAAALGFILLRFGFQRGARSERDNQERRDTKAVATRDRIAADVNRAPKEEVRKRLERWAK